MDCAVTPGSDFAPDCLVELDGDTLVIRHPDGSFRRLVRDGDGFASADGAAEPVMTSADDRIEFTVDGARYRWQKGQLDGR